MIKLFCCGILATIVYSNNPADVKHSTGFSITDTSGKRFDFPLLPAASDNGYTVKELPRPNSGTFSYEEAEKRKNEIYSLQRTPKHFNWKNPTTGGAVHINKKDEAEVYQFTFGIYESRSDSSVHYNMAAKDGFIVLKNIKDLHYHIGGVGFGNPASVLITSEIDLKKSKIFEEIMEELWVPAIQIYYLAEKK